MHYCYMLGCSDGSFNIGVSNNPNQRCAAHNAGTGSNWTATRLPVQLIWVEQHGSLASARRREIQLKHWSRAKKKALISASNPPNAVDLKHR